MGAYGIMLHIELQQAPWLQISSSFWKDFAHSFFPPVDFPPSHYAAAAGDASWGFPWMAGGHVCLLQKM